MDVPTLKNDCLINFEFIVRRMLGNIDTIICKARSFFLTPLESLIDGRDKDEAPGGFWG